MSLLRRAASNLSEMRAQMGASGTLPWGDSTPPPPGALGGSAAGVQVNESTALQIGAVYASVNCIATDIAVLPIKTLKVQQDKPAVAIPNPTIVAEPFAEISPIDFYTQGTASVLLRGNFNGKVLSRNSRSLLPEQVKPIHPDSVRVRRIPSGPNRGQPEWRYHGVVQNTDDVTIMRGLSMPESLLGIDPISAMRHMFGSAHALDLYQGTFFANSSQPDGVIEVAGYLDDEQTRKLAMSWMEHHQGINKSYLPAVITEGATYKPITISPQNAQFLEQMQLSAYYITGMIFRIPPHKFGFTEKSTSYGTGIEHQNISYVTDCLLGWIRRWELLLSSWLPVNQVAMFDLSHRLRGDSLQRWQVYQIGRVVGAMNNAEIRNAEGMPLVEDDSFIDAYDAPLNSAPMKPVSPATGPDQKD